MTLHDHFDPIVQMRLVLSLESIMPYTVAQHRFVQAQEVIQIQPWGYCDQLTAHLKPFYLD